MAKEILEHCWTSSFGEDWNMKLWDDGQFDLKICDDPTHCLTTQDRRSLETLINQFAEIFRRVEQVQTRVD